MKRLRLIKLVIQPVIVVDDGTNLSEMNAQPFEVSGAMLLGWADRFMGQLAEKEAELNQEDDDG